jgi:hypothetical protein
MPPALHCDPHYKHCPCHHPPQARTEAGVPEGAVRVTDEALAALVEDYARQVGGWGIVHS